MSEADALRARLASIGDELRTAFAEAARLAAASVSVDQRPIFIVSYLEQVLTQAASDLVHIGLVYFQRPEQSVKILDIVSGGDLVGTIREALREALRERPELGYANLVDDYLNELAARVTQGVGAIVVNIPVVELAIDQSRKDEIARVRGVCTICKMPAQPTETDDDGRCADCQPKPLAVVSDPVATLVAAKETTLGTTPSDWRGLQPNTLNPSRRYKTKSKGGLIVDVETPDHVHPINLSHEMNAAIVDAPKVVQNQAVMTRSTIERMQRIGRDEDNRRTTIALADFDALCEQAKRAAPRFEADIEVEAHFTSTAVLDGVRAGQAELAIEMYAQLGRHVINAFCDRCERLNANIFAQPETDASARISKIDQLIAGYFEMPNNSQGGPLHTVLSASNWGDSTIDGAILLAGSVQDSAGVALGMLLRSMSYEDRMKLECVCECGCTPGKGSK